MSDCRANVLLTILLTLGAATVATAQHVNSTPQGLESVTAQRQPGSRPDTTGLSPFSFYSRSPFGLLYPEVWQLPQRAAVEFGGLATAGDTDSAAFQEYGDWSDGAILHRFWFLAETPESGSYFEAAAFNAGRDDQSYRLTWGRHGAFELAGFFDSIPHVFSNNARILWDGAGGTELTLPAGLTPAGSTAAEVEAAFDNIGFSTLALKREQYGLSLRVSPSRGLSLFATASNEERDGSRAFGGVFTYPTLGQVTETVAPVDYMTTNFGAGLQYAGLRHQFNIEYSGSLFRNNDEALVWENPGLASFAPFIPERGRAALAPDNDYHNLRADYGTRFDFWNARLTATASYSRMRQDDSLLPHTISSGVLTPGNGVPIDLDLWNSVDGLSQRSADAAIDNRLAHLRLVLQPARRFRLTGELRYRDEDNRTDYLALNPLTGQYGYIALDGGLGDIISRKSAVFDTAIAGSRVRIRNMPFEKDEVSAELRGDYRLASKTKLALSVGRSEFEYSQRERTEVNDSIYRIELNQRDFLRGSIRFGYEFISRDGDEYISNPYETYYSSSLPGFTPRTAAGPNPHTLDEMRKFDLADKDSHAVDARLLTVLTDAADISVAARWKQDNLKTGYGLNDAESLSLNAEWNYRLARNANLYLYYAYQSHERNIANINDSGTSNPDGSAGGIVYPFSNVWTEFIDESNQSVGTGFSRHFQRFSIDLQYAYSMSDSRFSYDFASAEAAFPPLDPAETGSQFPLQTFRHHLLDASVRWFFSDDLGMRVFYRYEQQDIDDFHYDGLVEPVVNNAIYLVTVPENFGVSVVGVLFEKTF